MAVLKFLTAAFNKGQKTSVKLKKDEGFTFSVEMTLGTGHKVQGGVLQNGRGGQGKFTLTKRGRKKF